MEGGQKTTNTLKNAQVGSNHEDSNYPRLLEILGPSRSGKTTLETLVSTLEGVSRGYESGIISDTSDKVLASVGLPKTESLSALPEIQKELFRNQVRSHLENTFGSKDLITITRPGGIYSAPTLPALIPNIKFVFIQRDMDDLTYRIYASNYRQSNAYSYSIRTIRQYIEWYTQIMLSMKEKFPDIVHLISYEQMVENPQATLSDIAEFVGLAMSKHDILPIHDDRGCAQPYIQFMADEAEREGH